jgi:predicted transcriptional regulator of viral defense system
VRVAFFPRTNLEAVPTRVFNTPRGTIAVSTPEATAVDLLGHTQHVGGLDQVATVLAELAEQLDADKLVDAARTAPLSSAQRLGYVLNYIGSGEKAESLRQYVHGQARDYTPLIPSATTDDAARDSVWKVVVNEHIEADV